MTRKRRNKNFITNQEGTALWLSSPAIRQLKQALSVLPVKGKRNYGRCKNTKTENKRDY